MFSRNTAPAQWSSGKDSIGRHVRCCPINSSACDGLNTVGSTLRFVVLGLVYLDLLVEPVGNTLQLVDGGVVLLDLYALHIVHGLLLIGRWLFAGLRNLAHGVVAFQLNAGDIGVDCLVIIFDSLLSRDHFLKRRSIAIGRMIRRLLVAAVRVGRSSRQNGSRRNGNEQ